MNDKKNSQIEREKYLINGAWYVDQLPTILEE